MFCTYIIYCVVCYCVLVIYVIKLYASDTFARLAVPVGCVGDVAKDSLRRNGHLSRLGFGNSPEAWNTEHVGAGCRRSRGA